MAQIQKASLEAIEECKKMTALMSAAIDERAKQQRDYDELAAEYQRKLGIYNTARAVYNMKCGDECASGGFDCHPMCQNWARLNPEPIMPERPIFPDLGTFVCTICNQSVDLSAAASRDVNIARDAVQQQMNCISRVGQTAGDTAQTDTATAAPAAAAPKSTAPADETKKWYIYGAIGVVIILIAIAIVIYFVMGDDDDESWMRDITSQ